MSDQEAFVSELPLPVAQLYLRGRNAKTPLERYLAAYYLWEGSLKLLASTAIIEYAERDEHDPEIEERLHSLARPSTGHWWEFVRLLVPVLAETDDEFAKIKDVLFDKRRDDMPRAASLDAMLREQLDGKSRSQSTVKLTELFDRLVAFRNRELGHGAAGQQDAEHYNKLGRVLLLGMAELLKRIDVTAGRRLIFVADVRRRNTGDWEVDRFALRGETAWRLDSEILESTSASDLPSPEHVYIDGPADGDALRSLHPLVLYDAESSEAFFLNGRRGKKQADYLCYTSGNVVRRAGLQQTQKELLSRVLKIKVEDAEVETWSAEIAGGEVDFSEQEKSASETIGEYELISLIGRGGMGEVYRVWQPSLGREVALKTLIRAGDEKSEARFAREIRALGKVEHPHLVKIFTAATHEDQWFYTMELIEGTDLEVICKRLASNGPADVDKATWRDALSSAIIDTRTGEKQLTKADNDDITQMDSVSSKTGSFALDPDAEFGDYVAEMVEFARQTAEAAHALHEVGVVHRDIKPGNIMIDGRGKAVLMDLGLAKLDSDQGQVTKTRQFVGTICYASPEQVMSSKELDLRSDVYSIGATLWEMLALRPPFDASDESSTLKLMLEIQQKEPDSIRKHNPKVSRDLEAIVQKCMEKDPEARYQTARELADDLARFQKDEPIVARHIGPVRRFAKRCRRRPVVTAMCVTMVALVAAVAGLLIFKPEPVTPVPGPTQWEVLVSTYPGSVDQWWFDDREIAWQMLPVFRAELTPPSQEQVNKLTSDGETLELADAHLRHMFHPAEASQFVSASWDASRSKLSGPHLDPLRELAPDAKLAEIQSAYNALDGANDKTPQIEHTLALLKYRLAALKDSEGEKQTLRKAAQNHFTSAMEGYKTAFETGSADAPLGLLCMLDEAQLWVAMNERQEAVDKLEKLHDLLSNEAVKWENRKAIDLLQIVVLCKLGNHYRTLSSDYAEKFSNANLEKEERKNLKQQVQENFKKAEDRFGDATRAVEKLAENLSNNPLLGDQLSKKWNVHILRRQGFLYMDHWRADEASKRFSAAAEPFQEQHELKVDNVATADELREKLDALESMFGVAMAMRYQGKDRQPVIQDEFDMIVNRAERLKETAVELRSQQSETDRDELGSLIDDLDYRIANCLERYADSLPIPSSERENKTGQPSWLDKVMGKDVLGGSRLGDKRLTVLNDAYKAASRSRIGFKLAIEQAIQQQPVDRALIKRPNDSIHSDVATLAGELADSKAKDFQAAFNELHESLVGWQGRTTREDIEVRLTAWRLFEAYSDSPHLTIADQLVLTSRGSKITLLLGIAADLDENMKESQPQLHERKKRIDYLLAPCRDLLLSDKIATPTATQ